MNYDGHVCCLGWRECGTVPAFQSVVRGPRNPHHVGQTLWENLMLKNLLKKLFQLAEFCGSFLVRRMERKRWRDRLAGRRRRCTRNAGTAVHLRPCHGLALTRCDLGEQ